MAKETMRDKIERLEKELEEERERNEQLRKSLYQKQDESDEAFKGSPMYKQLLSKMNVMEQYKDMYDRLREKYEKEHDANVELRKEIQKLKSEKVHNARGAGRKPTMSEDLKRNICSDRDAGLTIKELAEKYGYSVGAIHRLIHLYSNCSEIKE